VLEKYSFGVGDRFGHQAAAQLRAFQMLEANGVVAVPVWNKSNREHTFIGSEPASVLYAAEQAVADTGWKHPWHVDADHIRIDTVDRFIDSSDFFTIDVANYIGKPPSDAELAAFLSRHPELAEPISIPGVSEPIHISWDSLQTIARQYLSATQEAGHVYRHIALHRKGRESIIEVSIDETPSPQTPAELLVILAALSDQDIPLQTIAPKFTGRFNKGVDYVGNVTEFAREFEDCIAILKYAVEKYAFPGSLKLSVHSGSDKFSIYPIIARLLRKTDAGLHVKTAGTSWLAEIIGLCEAGGDGLTIVQEMYAAAFQDWEALCLPYADVIDIDPSKLPSPETISNISGSEFALMMQHDPASPNFNTNVRQLMHVSFKLAAKKGTRYLDLLIQHSDRVGQEVTDNIYHKHLKPLFLS
jgi:tagaturonate epimerase